MTQPFESDRLVRKIELLSEWMNEDRGNISQYEVS